MRIKKTILACGGLTFVLLSFFCISTGPESEPEQPVSSKLDKKITYEDNRTIEEFLDENGEPAVAVDLGYAVRIAMKTDEDETEAYYDSNWNPTIIKAGYHAVLKEKDEEKRLVRNTYLDIEGKPVLSSAGYAIEDHYYSEEGLELSVRYYDTKGNPICTASYGCGKDNEYDEDGRACKITYIDETGKPFRTKRGYAIVTRTYYKTDGPENGKTEYELYYDENENPISLSLGEFGIHKEHCEDYTVITYLDANGRPTVTSLGYASIRRTLGADNSVEKERYYDLDGSPVSLAGGQYGIKKENGKTVYLDRDGNEVFNVKTFLYNNTRWVVVFVLILISLTIIMEKKHILLLSMIYVLIILYMTLLFRDAGKPKTDIGLLWSYRQFFNAEGARAEILQNVWLFIPLGAFLYRLYPKKIILLIPVALSVLIEGLQYFSSLGYCELDDIVSNGLGGWIGFAAGGLTKDLKNRIKKWKPVYSK